MDKRNEENSFEIYYCIALDWIKHNLFYKGFG